MEEPDDNPKGLHSYFNRTNFGVTLSFKLFEKSGDRDYSETDVKYLLSLVHTRFSRVMTDRVMLDTVDSLKPEHYISKVAATLNKEKRQFYHAKPNNMIQIFIPFHIDVGQRMISVFEVAKKMAIEANAMYPNTVPYLLMDMSFMTILQWPKDNDFHNAVKYMSDFGKPTKQSPEQGDNLQPFQMGIILKLETCQIETDDYFNPEIAEQIFPHVQIAFIRPEFMDINDGSEEFWNENKKLESCATKIKNTFPNMTVGFIYRVRNTVSHGRISEPLIKLWEEIDHYSAKHNTPVFMAQVFDDLENNDYNGWWKTTKVGDGNYLLQEKYQILYRRTSFGDDTLNTNTLEMVIGSTFAGCLVIAIVLFMVYKIYKIKYRPDAFAALSRLSDTEILEFFSGRSQTENKDADMSLSNNENDNFRVTHIFTNTAYDQDLEVDRNAFILEDTQKLGSGAYGQVCLGRVFLAGNETRVAAKQNTLVGSETEKLTSLRSLLSEIKVLSFIGRHDNVVALLGAHTANLSKGEVYVFLELCAQGSLKKCLQTLRNSDNDPYTRLFDSPHCANPLTKWSLEIAKGMEFLATKYVVHADLATRNVLLDSNSKAKICDFGLSRRMLNYQSYVKSHQEPLPWRWMSPESLRTSIFNEKTDVWSFGVTMWEIFTLGNLPYAGLSWTVDFATSLEEDLRLPFPKRKSGPLFKEKNLYPLMQRCWETDPNLRPTFQELVQILMQE